jgi:cytochrome c-type biogenesis protein CcmH
MVCRNESIDESNADLARDLRLLVRERLVLGDTDDEVIEHVVGRYGEYVLLRPTGDGSNLILWGAPLALLLLGGGVAAGHIAGQRRAVAAPRGALDPEEEARLRALMDEGEGRG